LISGVPPKAAHATLYHAPRTWYNINRNLLPAETAGLFQTLSDKYK